MSKLHDLAQLGQAIWLDDIRRSYLTNGELAELVKQGLRGLTSNPTIFEKAINGSADYDAQMRALVRAGKSTTEIYEALAIDDIRQAADILRPVYDQTDGADGFVSLEVDPALAHDTARTIAEARRLFETVDRPNLMIKIPATAEGIPAIQATLANGINVNVTLIFSVTQYLAVVEAFLSGLEKLAASGREISRVASVASFFISRVDTAVDKALQAVGNRELQGKIAVANAKLAYACFQEMLASPRWKKLAEMGARPQRPLWASTSTKNPAYPDTLYVDNLIGPYTVNTLPLATLQALIDHGRVERTIDQQVDQARAQLAQLTALGIDFEAIAQTLQDEGVAAFARSFETLMQSIAEKSQRMALAFEYSASIQAQLDGYQSRLDAALSEIASQRVIQRIWLLDHTVWKPEPNEIANRLGWLDVAAEMRGELPRLEALAEQVRMAGCTHALLLGMGGSSLAPEVLRKTFGVAPGFLDLAVLDSTDPGAVLEYTRQLDPARTLYIVSTKSGGTVETFSFLKYFYNHVASVLGAKQAGEHFIAITDPGSKLAEVAEQLGFRAVLLNNPNIGGRYSALSFFGLAPAALVGVNLKTLLERAEGMRLACQADVNGEVLNPGALLGSIIGELAKAGRDKLTLIISPAVCTFGDWVEQLIAESTGKDGKGILPVVGEPIGEPEIYGPDRAFVYLRLAEDHSHDLALLALEAAGHPVIRIEMRDLYDLGAQFFLWEFATAVAGERLGIQPFDQPNVEAAKALARKMVAAYHQEGKLPQLTPVVRDQGIEVYGDVQADSLAQAWKSFLSQAGPGSYIAIQAYIQPGEESDASLLALRDRLRQATRLAVTTGYGPRFLHSTGQLHKGDAGQGLFVQITADPEQDVPIPDEAGAQASSMTFGVLEAAQALGDRQALLDARRKVLRFHLGKDVLVGLSRLTLAIS
jgi:transaldolase/glucose-6-phosphate isomerase